MSRVLLVTTEPVPLEGWPATGAGLRAWGLAMGLRSRGHEVTLLTPEDALAGFAPPPGRPAPTRDLPPWIGLFRRGALKDDPRISGHDCVVLQHWGVARELGDPGVPLAVDLAGPHLLERLFWGSKRPEEDLLEKLEALRRADFLTAGGRDQRLYFLPFLTMAGWDLSAGEDPLPVIPFSLKAAESPAPPRADRFLYGGFFLPWQNPERILETALEEMDRAGRGELVFVGGAHPRADVSGGGFQGLLERLEASPRVRRLSPMAYADYVDLLKEGGVALDLMTRNPERELAYTTRTVQYMALGIPVIHDGYSELSRWIRERGAGWCFDPEDADGPRRLIRSLLVGETDPAPPGRAAWSGVAASLDWDRTIEPLDRFCRDPRFRKEKTGNQLAFEAREKRAAKLESDLRRTESELAALRGKRWVRWGLRLLSPRKALLPLFGLAAALVGLALIPVFWINDRAARRIS